QGHGSVLPAEAGAEALSHHVRALARPGDLVIGMGAGTITEWMHLLPKLLPDADMAAGGAA
ncbi:MAG: UDP-N-acetylmuramate--L-alanine ligase, partial [Alphaproteobacteria bacterium]